MQHHEKITVQAKFSIIPAKIFANTVSDNFGENINVQTIFRRNIRIYICDMSGIVFKNEWFMPAIQSRSTSGPDPDLKTFVRIRSINGGSEYGSASVPALPSANIGEPPPAIQREERIRVEASPTKGQEARISFSTFSTISYNIIKKYNPAHVCKNARTSDSHMTKST